ncbi:hypothetical protein [Streptomyces sp. TP-A0356]|uniref:hypothetical protein n=1 Tax=Streptomyces sp. TP-A0356 TaxID=1359208 RepID=UPI000AA1EE49|nr:hypothetical protein [Streptomyces sp. TP-A0356]
MTLRFVGIDPDTGGEGSPTVWVEEESADPVLQGEEADSLLQALVGSTEWVPGHKTGIPAHERVIRIPARTTRRPLSLDPLCLAVQRCSQRARGGSWLRCHPAGAHRPRTAGYVGTCVRQL